MKDLSELQRMLAEMTASGPVEVYDGGQRVPQLDGFQFELRQQGSQLLLHLWTEDGNLVRRVLGIAKRTEDRLDLEVLRFGRKQPAKLEFVCLGSARPSERLTREKFRGRFRNLLVEQFPDGTLESLTTAPDLEYSLSGCYTRGVMRRGATAWAVMGASSAESAATLDAILTFGLLWLQKVRSGSARAVAGLRLMVPKGGAVTAAHRMRALGRNAKIELYEVDEAAWRVQRVDPNDAGNIATWLTPRREVDRTLAAAEDTIRRIRSLAPEAIDAVVPPGTRDVALRFRGLEFARWRGGKLEYGMPDERQPLKLDKLEPLKRLVRNIGRYRDPLAKNRNHPLYRAQPERWLEWLVLQDPARLDAHLNPRFLYSQVPAFSAGDRGVLDLLGVRLDGRLVVIELKASEDVNLVLQAADYWLRVKAHHQEGEFQRYGYFQGVELQQRPATLYLVAPGFRFHSGTDAILRNLAPEIQVVRVGLNENWRKGIQVVFRQ